MSRAARSTAGESGRPPTSRETASRWTASTPGRATRSPRGRRRTRAHASRPRGGVDSVIARPGHIFGPAITAGDSRAHAQFARSAAAGEPVVLKSAGRQLRSYCYVADCVGALVFLALHGASGEAYNVANPESDTTVYGLAKAFAEAAGVPLDHADPEPDEARGTTPWSAPPSTRRSSGRSGGRGTSRFRGGLRGRLSCLLKQYSDCFPFGPCAIHPGFQQETGTFCILAPSWHKRASGSSCTQPLFNRVAGPAFVHFGVVAPLAGTLGCGTRTIGNA